MKKKDIGILGKLVADNFNSMTDKEQKEELEKKFREAVKHTSLNPPIYSSIAQDLVVNEKLLKIVKPSTFESLDILTKDGAVLMTEVEVLEKMKSLRSSASERKNNNNNSNI